MLNRAFIHTLLLIPCPCFTEDPPVGGTDVDIQLLEAAKAGDMEVVKVIIHDKQTFMSLHLLVETNCFCPILSSITKICTHKSYI